jgi:hypothetical protein
VTKRLTVTVDIDGRQGDARVEIPENYGYARLNYTSAHVVPDINDAGGQVAAPVTAHASMHSALSKRGQATIAVGDYDGASEIVVHIETAQGVVVRQLAAKRPVANRDGSFEALVTYRASVLKTLLARLNAPATAFLQRSGRCFRLGAPNASFASFRLFVCPVTNGDAAALRALLGNPQVALKSIDSRDPGVLAELGTLRFTSATLRSDGSFDLKLAVPRNTVKTGWVWLLTGSDETFIGHVKEDANNFADPTIKVTIVLPAASTNDDAEALAIASTGSGIPAKADRCGTCGPGGTPLDFDEQQLIREPGAFSDDPGPYCRPFKNPQRILGERSFQTVLRVEQPEIGAKASISPATAWPSDLIRGSRWRTAITLSELLEDGPQISALSRVAVASRAAPSPDAMSASPLTPRTVAYVRDLLGSPTVRGVISSDNPVQWEGDASRSQATSLAKGHILEWRVRWRSNGYSLGDVVFTLPLAPRQVKRINKVSWERRERSSRSEVFAVREQVRQDTDRERSYTEAVQASLNEWSKGGSSSSTTGAAGGIGFALGSVVVGGGAAHGSASSSSWEQGGRNVAAAEQQSLRDAIRQYGESLRRVESTIVTEVTQQEAVEGVSEVLRNPNYCHSLTVIYYQILRHLRVDTELVGVRECLFIPFSMRPFDLARVIRWRDLLERGLRKPELQWVMQHLEDLRNNFAGSLIPPGPRADHPITFVRGSVYVQLSIERPRTHKDPIDDLNDELWKPFAALFGTPWREIAREMQARDEARRDRYYQTEVAPTMAVRWANRLRISAAGRGTNIPLNTADFTLVSQYGFNRTVRIDFTYVPAAGEVLTRRDLQTLQIRSPINLPPGSVANVQRVQYTYRTERFERDASYAGSSDDLISIDGTPDPTGARSNFPLSNWEMRDLRQEIRDTADDLVLHLNEHVEHYHKVLFWSLDRDKLYMLLDAFRLSATDGRSIASVVEREPIGILGNSLIFRVSAGAFIGVDGHASHADLLNHYKDNAAPSEPIRVSLPTDGLYAQAIMDECNACEEHSGSVDWVLNDAEPELERLGVEALRSRRSDPSGMTPTSPPASLINFPAVPGVPDPQGFGATLDALTKGDSFRDMAGLAGTQKNAAAALSEAAGLAGAFGQKALDLSRSKLGTDDAKKKLDNIRRARADGLISNEEATSQAKRVLEDQNISTDKDPLTQEAPLEDAIQQAGAAGQPIEATRQSRDGTETLRIGGPQRRLMRLTRDGVVEVEDSVVGGSGEGAETLLESPQTRKNPKPITTELFRTKVNEWVYENLASLEASFKNAHLAMTDAAQLINVRPSASLRETIGKTIIGLIPLPDDLGPASTLVSAAFGYFQDKAGETDEKAKQRFIDEHQEFLENIQKLLRAAIFRRAADWLARVEEMPEDNRCPEQKRIVAVIAENPAPAERPRETFLSEVLKSYWDFQSPEARFEIRPFQPAATISPNPPNGIGNWPKVVRAIQAGDPSWNSIKGRAIVVRTGNKTRTFAVDNPERAAVERFIIEHHRLLEDTVR